MGFFLYSRISNNPNFILPVNHMHIIFRKRVSCLSKYLTLVLIGCFIFTSCTKSDPPLTPEQQVVQYLTGTGNKYWRIKEIYVNAVPVALTSSQLEYFKTYTIYASIETNSGTFVDKDNSMGTWELKTAGHITETITNNISGPIVLDLTINHLDANNMDVQYTANGQTVRSVYYAN